MRNPYTLAKKAFEHWHFLSETAKWIHGIFGVAMPIGASIWALAEGFSFALIIFSGLIGLGIGVLIVIAGVERLYKNRKANAPHPIQQSQISFIYTRTKRPKIVPPKGIIYFVALWASANPLLGHGRTIGLGNMIGVPSEEYNWGEQGNDDAYKCVIRNFGKDIIQQMQAEFSIEFNAMIKTENGSREGELIDKYEHTVTIREPVAPNDTFEFFFLNDGSETVHVKTPNNCIVVVDGEEKTVGLMPNNEAHLTIFPSSRYR